MRGALWTVRGLAWLLQEFLSEQERNTVGSSIAFSLRFILSLNVFKSKNNFKKIAFLKHDGVEIIQRLICINTCS